MQASQTSKSTDPTGREMVVTRVLDAPVALVFEVYTDPKHVRRWWGPHGFSNTISAMDVRPGGVWTFVMHGPDGVDYPNQITYLEVDPPHRLVYNHNDMFISTVTFDSVGAAKTRITMRAVFRTAEMRDAMVKKHRADEGGTQHLQRLAEHLAQLSGPAKPELVMKRTFNAPRAVVFKAWTAGTTRPVVGRVWLDDGR